LVYLFVLEISVSRNETEVAHQL